VVASPTIPSHPAWIAGHRYRFPRFWEIHIRDGCEVGMKGDYPRFNATYTHNELVEHFLLTPLNAFWWN
jgi:hypothetical protein